jgi:predicted Rossmann-fold nucleotide-binding protein
MKYKIGVFGSSAGDMEKVVPKAVEIGEALARHADSVIVITGACTGLPYVAAKAAADKGVEVWGYSSSLNFEALQQEYPDDDLTIYKKVIYVPQEFPLAKNDRSNKKYRNVISTGNCDAGIIISGRWGTLNEFTNLIDQQKVVGVLTGTGGIADELESLLQKISKAGQGEVIFNNDPTKLFNAILEKL